LSAFLGVGRVAVFTPRSMALRRVNSVCFLHLLLGERLLMQRASDKEKETRQGYKKMTLQVAFLWVERITVQVSRPTISRRGDDFCELSLLFSREKVDELNPIMITRVIPSNNLYNFCDQLA